MQHASSRFTRMRTDTHSPPAITSRFRINRSLDILFRITSRLSRMSTLSRRFARNCRILLANNTRRARWRFERKSANAPLIRLIGEHKRVWCVMFRVNLGHNWYGLFGGRLKTFNRCCRRRGVLSLSRHLVDYFAAIVYAVAIYRFCGNNSRFFAIDTSASRKLHHCMWKAIERVFILRNVIARLFFRYVW